MIRNLMFLAALTSTAAVADDGWTTLYDGKDLSKFETTGNWMIQKDGSLFLKPRPGEKGWQRYGSYLWVKGDYADFTCEFEYKHEKGGNSGFYFRVPDTSKPTTVGVEVQILDCHGKKTVGFHDLGGIIKFNDVKKGAPLLNAAIPSGEWNKVRVTLQNNLLTVVINGKTAQDKVDLTKNQLAGGLVAKGRIGIQDHGLPFWVRNIRIKKLAEK